MSFFLSPLPDELELELDEPLLLLPLLLFSSSPLLLLSDLAQHSQNIGHDAAAILFAIRPRREGRGRAPAIVAPRGLRSRRARVSPLSGSAAIIVPLLSDDEPAEVSVKASPGGLTLSGSF